MQHSKLIDSFSTEDEHFFRSYEAEPVDAEGPLTLEFDPVGAQRSTTERLAHLTRFRRPVAWVTAAMGLLSLVALGQRGLQQNSRREVASHVGSASALPTSTAAMNFASVSAVPARSVFASAAEPTSEAPWSWTELAERALALVLEPTRPRTSGSELPWLATQATQATQASLVNDFTSDLLSMCRDVPS